MLDAAILFLATLFGGLVSLRVRWTERLLHVALAFSTGIFLGAVFLHLLPSLDAAGDAHSHHWEASVLEARSFEESPPAHSSSEGKLSVLVRGDRAWFFVLLGVLGVYLIEALVLRTHDHDDLHRHRAVGYAALVGLSVHSFTAGLALAVMAGRGLLVGTLLLAMVAHKIFDSFSLASVLLLGKMRRARIHMLIAVFSTITQIGLLVGGAATTHLGQAGMTIVTALAAGTFLFVCVGELLPEVFHHREDSLAKVSLLAAGVAVTMLMHGVGA